MQHRLGQYREKTAPLIDYYANQEILRKVDGARTPDQVHDQIRAILASRRFED